MVKICVYNNKGGVGKSTISVNLCGMWSTNKKCLLVDLDNQHNSSDYLLNGIKAPYSIYDMFAFDKDIEECIVNISLSYNNKVNNNVDVIASSDLIDTLSVDNISLLKEKIKTIENNYDYIIFDCPPHLSNFTIMSMVSSDYVLVPALADTDSLNGYDQLLSTVNNIREQGYNINLQILGILFNNVESNNALGRYMIETCKVCMKNTILNTVLRKSSAIGQARFFGKPINYYKASIPIVEDYKILVNEIEQKIGEK